MVVVDASAALAWLLDEPEAEVIVGLLLEHGGELLVPSVFWFEVPYVLDKRVAWRRITLAQRNIGVESVQQLGAETDLASAKPGLEYSRVLTLRDQFRLSFCDATYFELALRRDAALLALDKPLRRAAENAGLKTMGRA